MITSIKGLLFLTTVTMCNGNMLLKCYLGWVLSFYGFSGFGTRKLLNHRKYKSVFSQYRENLLESLEFSASHSKRIVSFFLVRKDTSISFTFSLEYISKFSSHDSSCIMQCVVSTINNNFTVNRANSLNGCFFDFILCHMELEVACMIKKK